MGYNTGIILLNDGIHNIRDDKEFGKKLYDAVSGFCLSPKYRDNTLYSGNGNVGEVVYQDHADNIHCVAMGVNSGWDLGVVSHWRSHRDSMANEDRELEFLKGLARNKGYVLRKNPERKKT